MVTRALVPTDYQHTRFLGFSVTRSWWDAFYAYLPTVGLSQSAFELLWYSGGSVDVWADPNSPAWTANGSTTSDNLVPADPGGQGGLINGISHAHNPTVGTSSIDRVIANVSGIQVGAGDPTVVGYNGGTRPDLGLTAYDQTGNPPGGYMGITEVWKAYINALVVNIRAKYPNVKMILLQPNLGGPGGAPTLISNLSAAGHPDSNDTTFSAGYGVVRCTYTEPRISSVIASVTRANVRPGYRGLASSDADFRDWAGHLVDGMGIGQAAATHYASNL